MEKQQNKIDKGYDHQADRITSPNFVLYNFRSKYAVCDTGLTDLPASTSYEVIIVHIH